MAETPHLAVTYRPDVSTGYLISVLIHDFLSSVPIKTS